MTHEEARAFLIEHQPLPSTRTISDELIAEFEQISKHLAAHPDSSLLPLLLGALGEGSGHGAYQRIDDTLRAHPIDDVLQAIQQGLHSECKYTVEWCAEFAMDFFDERLLDALFSVAQTGSTDAQMYACYAICLSDSDKGISMLKKLHRMSGLDADVANEIAVKLQERAR
ncbi:MAG: hypothetical protein ACK5RJ_12195 [Burkholderiales bacterium]|jgi:hypothetical protein|nr:hypothetical protein [Rhodocyclaceae bacterium]MCA3053131.1 hypothetical protein [Rhodocyclaceae bacterium]